MLLAHLLYKVLEAGSARSTVSLSQVYQPVIRVLTKRATASVFVAAPAVFGSFVGLYTALDAHLISVWHFSPEALLATEAVGCLGLAAALTMRHWAPKLMNPRSQTLLGFSIAAAGVLVAQFGTLWLYPIAGSICYVAGISLVVPGLVGLLAVHAADARGAAVAANTFMLFVGAAAAPFVVGHLGYRPSLAVLAAALLGPAGVITARVPREAQAGQPSGQQGEPPPGDRAATTPTGLKPHQGPPGQGSRSPRVPDRDPQSLPSRIR